MWWNPPKHWTPTQIHKISKSQEQQQDSEVLISADILVCPYLEKKFVFNVTEVLHNQNSAC